MVVSGSKHGFVPHDDMQQRSMAGYETPDITATWYVPPTTGPTRTLLLRRALIQGNVSRGNTQYGTVLQCG